GGGFEASRTSAIRVARNVAVVVGVGDAAAAAVVAVRLVEESGDAPTLRRYRDEEPFGEGRELRPAEAVRPLAIVGERPHRHEEGGRADPDVAFVADDDELLTEP